MKELFLIVLKQAMNASWIILAVLLARALTRRSAKWTRNILWALVAVRLIMPFALESPVSLVPTWQQETPQTVDSVPSTQEQPTSATVTVQVPNRVTEHQDTPAPSTQPVVDRENAGTQPGTAPVHQESPAPSAQIVAEQPSAEPVQRGALNPVDIAGAVWMLGVVLMLLYNIVCHLRLRRRIRDAVLAPDGVWESEWLNSGVVVGYLRPRVCLPFGIEPSVREHIVAHERAHIRRGDHLTKMFAYLLLAVFWFHPLVWVAYYLFCRDVELACDERVIRGLDDAGVRAYAHALLRYGSVDRSTAAAVQPAFAHTSVKTRLQNIVNYKKPTVWIIALTMVVCAITAVCFLTVPKQANASAIEPDAVGATDAAVESVTQPSTEETTEPEPTSAPEPVVEPEPEPIDEPEVYPEPVNVPAPEKRIAIQARDTILEGESMGFECVAFDEVLYKRPIGSLVVAQVKNAYENNNQQTFGIEYARSKEELITVISMFASMRGNERIIDVDMYDENFFKNNSLIFLYGEVYSVTLIKNESELCVANHIMKRMGSSTPHDMLTVVRGDPFHIIAVNDNLADIDTISYFVEAIDLTELELEPEPEPEPEPKTISIVPRTTPLEGELVDLTGFSAPLPNKIKLNMHTPVYHLDGTEITEEDFTYLSPAEYPFSVDLMFSQDELLKMYEDGYPAYQSHMMLESEIQKYDEEFFKKNALIAIGYCNLSGDYFEYTNIQSIKQSGGELSFTFETKIFDSIIQRYIVAKMTWCLYEIPYEQLYDIDTISFYAQGEINHF